MNVSREEAARALDDIGKAGDRIAQLKGYHSAAPHFIVWGLVWLFANSVTQFMPGQQRLAWPIGVVIGILASSAHGFLHARKHPRGTAANQRERWIGLRSATTSIVMFGFIFCTMWIARPESDREINAMISILFPFIYMGCGVWLGWRLFVIGFVTAAAIMAGYFFIGEYFPLWMGVFGGGSLIAGGIWLRTA